MASSSSNEERSKRGTGALQCSPMREIQLKMNCREKKNRMRKSLSLLSSTEREDALGCFDASLAVANLGFHVNLDWGEKSLPCFIFNNPCK